MTQINKRIKIAEACGWVMRIYGINNEPNEPDDDLGTEDKVWDSVSDLPDYFNDLRACHQFEEVLKVRKKGCLTYCAWLTKMCGCDSLLGGFEMVHATAEQRAEAFGKTLNLW